LPGWGTPQQTPQQQAGWTGGATYGTQPAGEIEYRSHPTWGLFIAGVIVFPVVYLLTVGVTAGLDTDGDDIGEAAIPLIGPFLMIGNPDTEFFEAPLAISGILQLAGLTMVILGLTIQSQSAVRRVEGLQVTPRFATNGQNTYAGLDLELTF
jgi:hypothetical protein